MSFKSEAAKVKSNIAAGAYKEKTNVWGGFFDELAYGIKKQDEEERQERLEARREARANGRRIKAKQDAQDKQDKQDTALTNLYLTMNDIYPTPQNISSVLSVVQGGARSITDLTTVMDKTSTVKRAVPPAPAPSVPTPRTNASGTMPTSQTSTATGSSLEDEMPMTRKVDEEKRDAEVLETLTNNSGIEPDMIQFGVQPDDVKDMDIDAVRFELSDTTISEERRALLKRRLSSLTDPKTVDWLTDTVTKTNIASFTASVDAALEKLDEYDPRRLALLERTLHIKSVASMLADASSPALTPEKAYLQKLQKLPVWENLTETQKLDAMTGFKQYTSADMTNPADVRESLRIATLIGDQDAITRLTGLLNDDPNLMSKVYVVGEDGVGRLQWVNGKNELATGTDDTIVQTIPWTKEAGQFIQSRTGQMTTSVNAYNKKLGNVFSLANGMSEIIQITKNNPDVLTGTAGIVSSVKSILTNADTAFGVLSRMTEGDNTVTLSQYENALKNEGLLQEGESIDGLANQDLATSILGTDAVKLAQARKILEAKLVIMQFRTGGAEGQSSTAMSNADRVEFFKFLKKFDKGSDLEMVYMDYLQGQLNSLEQDYSNTFSKEKDNAKAQLGFIPDYIFALSPQDAANKAGEQMLSMYNAIKNRTSLPQNETLLQPVAKKKPVNATSSAQGPRADPPRGTVPITQDVIKDLNDIYYSKETKEGRAKVLSQFKTIFKIDGSQYLTGDK